MDGNDNPKPELPQSTGKPARIYVIKPFIPTPKTPSMDAGPGRSGAPAPPASALIHQESNNCIEIPATEGKSDSDLGITTAGLAERLPGRLEKKKFSIAEKVEGMVKKFGIERIAMQTLTIRENITDGKEFNKRFHSIASNVFPKLYQAWIRVYERQERGAWHVHIVVATKADIRTGCDPAALNQLLRDKKDRKISKAIYYSGIERLASPNLRALWKEFRRLCGLREFHRKRKSNGKRYYKFDANHLLPIIKGSKALASYVSKYISKGFQHRRKEDKGMRLVACSRNVSQICSERFCWAEGAGKVLRSKMKALAEMVNFHTMDDFAKALGPKWAYHIRPALDVLMLPYYASMKEARADVWDLVSTTDGTPWPWPNLDVPRPLVQQSRTEAFKIVKQLIDRRRGTPRRKSRAEMAWDPERWEEIKREKREYKVFKPPVKPRVLMQGEFLGLDPPRIIKD
jgi:hypothetical protein